MTWKLTRYEESSIKFRLACELCPYRKFHAKQLGSLEIFCRNASLGRLYTYRKIRENRRKKRKVYSRIFCTFFLRSAPLFHISLHFDTLIAKYAKMGAKNKKYSRVFCAFFCVPSPFFTFRCISRECRHSCKNWKDFVVYFFAALIKHEIRVKCEKCIVSVSYFVMCFVKNTRKMQKVYSRP